MLDSGSSFILRQSRLVNQPLVEGAVMSNQPRVCAASVTALESMLYSSGVRLSGVPLPSSSSFLVRPPEPRMLVFSCCIRLRADDIAARELLSVAAVPMTVIYTCVPSARAVCNANWRRCVLSLSVVDIAVDARAGMKNRIAARINERRFVVISVLLIKNFLEIVTSMRFFAGGNFLRGALGDNSSTSIPAFRT